MKSAVRQFDFANIALGAFQVVTHAIAESDSLPKLSNSLYDALAAMPLDARGNPTHEYHRRVSVAVGDRVLMHNGYSEEETLSENARLERRGLQRFDATGDGYVIDGHTFLVKIAATDTNDVAYHLMHQVGTPTLPGVLVTRVFTKAIATLARRAARTHEGAGVVA